jgi:hypothetical protein
VFLSRQSNKASELGRLGGRKKRSAVTESADPLPKVEAALAVRDTLAQLITDGNAGKLHPRIASGLAPLLNLLRAIETSDLEHRLRKVEKFLQERTAPSVEAVENSYPRKLGQSYLGIWPRACLGLQ